MTTTRERILTNLRNWLVLNLFLGLMPLMTIFFGLYVLGVDATILNLVQHGAILSPAFGLAAGSFRRLVLSSRSTRSGRFIGIVRKVAPVVTLVLLVLDVQLLSILTVYSSMPSTGSLDTDNVVRESLILYLVAALVGAGVEVLVAFEERITAAPKQSPTLS